MKNLNLYISCMIASMLLNISEAKGQADIAGKLNWETLPFRSAIYTNPYGTGGLAEQHLYWYAYISYYKDIAKSGVTSCEKNGLIPMMGMQGWGDDYFNAKAVKDNPNLALPANDPLNIGYANFKNAAFEEFVNWRNSRMHYWAINLLGDYPSYNDSRPNRGKIYEAIVSPVMPLDPQDTMDGKVTTYGEWMGEQIGQLCAHMGGVRGIGLSDYYDSNPGDVLSNNRGDFNSRVIKLFYEKTGLTVSGTTYADSCNAILNNYRYEWIDYWCKGYATFWAKMVQSIQAHHPSNWPGIILGQCESPIAYRRRNAVDHRINAQLIGGDHAYFGWDAQRMVWSRKNYAPESTTPSILGIAAAYEPLIHHWANMECVCPDYWGGVYYNFPNLTGEGSNKITYSGEVFTLNNTQMELGRKRLKRLWLETAFAHIADRDGNVRRAVCAFERYYWDNVGSIDASIVQVYNSIRPKKAFGPAVYYSEAIQRHCEKNKTTYMGTWNEQITEFREKGIACNYYVSDAALDHITENSKPAFWILPVQSGITLATLPAEEKAKLEAIAPIVESTNVTNYKGNVLNLSGGNYNATGYGFYDQNDRLIIAVSDRIQKGETNSNLPSTRIRITIKLDEDGAYHATEQFTGEVINFTVVEGIGLIVADLERWDTKVFAIEKGSSSGLSPIAIDNMIMYYDGQVNFSGEIASYSVYNTTGGLIRNGNNESFNISYKGIYIIKAQTRSGETVTKKLIR